MEVNDAKAELLIIATGKAGTVRKAAIRAKTTNVHANGAPTRATPSVQYLGAKQRGDSAMSEEIPLRI